MVALPGLLISDAILRKGEHWVRMSSSTVVRRSARLIAAATLESPAQTRAEKCVPSKRVRMACGARRSSRIAETESHGPPETRKILVVKTTNGVKCEDGTVESVAFEASIVSEVMEVKAKGSALRRTTTLRRLPSRDLEMKLWELGFQRVAGVDEAGRGPLAGPVVAAACIIPASVIIPGVNDSKKLNETQRDELFAQITTTPGIVYAVHVVDAGTIDEINILQATLQAMSACVKKLELGDMGVAPDYILVDGNRLPDDFSKEKAQFVIKGDAECHVIAAASILAKVTRDRMMLDYDKKWPEYGFKAHKGYGTVAHMGAIMKYGPCDIHRRTFAPLKNQLLKNGDSK